MDKNSVSIYVDGSYDADTEVYGSGFIALLPDGKVEVYSKAGNNPETARLRNVAGEMIAAMSAVAYAVKRGFDSVNIFYDYLGIENWVTGAWKTKKSFTSEYARYMKEQGKRIDISFTKVAAHTNVEYNEIADGLAKEAVLNFC